jgi:hypothetical protein
MPENHSPHCDRRILPKKRGGGSAIIASSSKAFFEANLLS